MKPEHKTIKIVDVVVKPPRQLEFKWIDVTAETDFEKAWRTKWQADLIATVF